MAVKLAGCVLVAIAALSAAEPDDVLTRTLLEKISAQDNYIHELEARLDGTAGQGQRKLLFGTYTGSVSTSDAYVPQEPVIPGMLPGSSSPRILIAGTPNYPPYTTYVYPGDYEGVDDTIYSGFGPDVAEGLMEVCDIDVTNIEAATWDECWSDGAIGASLLAGYYHGCTTYTHTVGERNRFMEFSDPILDQNKEVGFMVRLDANGKPLINATSDLSDASITVMDVSGWAPTADTVTVLLNDCTNEYFKVATLISSDDTTGYDGDYSDNPNDVSLWALFNNQTDLVYIYSDQAYNYMAACAADESTAGVDCDLWNQFGTASGYAYLHMGMDEFAYAGTTLTMSKKGSGLADVVNPCIAAYLETEAYYNTCVKWDLVDSCFVNEFFPNATTSRRLYSKDKKGSRHVGRKLADADALYNTPTHEQTDGCDDGYCSCNY